MRIPVVAEVAVAPRRNGAPVSMRYVEGDTEPPPRLRRCLDCGESYDPRCGKACGCWQRGYDAQRAR